MNSLVFSRAMLGFVIVGLLCVALGAGLGVIEQAHDYKGGNSNLSLKPLMYMGIPVRDCSHLYSGPDEFWFACMGVGYVEPN